MGKTPWAQEGNHLGNKEHVEAKARTPWVAESWDEMVAQAMESKRDWSQVMMKRDPCLAKMSSLYVVGVCTYM